MPTPARTDRPTHAKAHQGVESAPGRAIARLGLMVAGAAMGLGSLMGCGKSAVSEPAAGMAASGGTPTLDTATADPGFVIRRVGGDMAAVAEERDGNWYAGPASITTSLPVGYPPPTPPGAIDLKHYPSVRRAEVDGSLTPDLGMNMAFFPLFRHIERNDIAMTSPVEMDYRDLRVSDGGQSQGGQSQGGQSQNGEGQGAAADDTDGEADDQAGEDQKPWTMSFLYRTADLGPTGTDPKDERVRIVDTEPMTVVSIGLRGGYSKSRVRAAVRTLEAWLMGQEEWDATGPARALYYNGPEKRTRDKWAEVQIPVRRIKPTP